MHGKVSSFLQEDKTKVSCGKTDNASDFQHLLLSIMLHFQCLQCD